MCDKLPEFKYNPNCYDRELEIFTYSEKGEVCECCGNKTQYYCNNLSTSEEVNCICPFCIKDGSAAKKFDGYFSSYFEDTEKISEEKIDELMKRTPSYMCWQEPEWLECCNDFCVFLGDVGTKELIKMGIADEVFEDFKNRDNCFNIEDVKEDLFKKGSMAGYLFKCSHCGKHRIHVDLD
ncbi:MAG: CbrC family protein [Sarcina sp.]